MDTAPPFPLPPSTLNNWKWVRMRMPAHSARELIQPVTDDWIINTDSRYEEV